LIFSATRFDAQLTMSQVQLEIEFHPPFLSKPDLEGSIQAELVQRFHLAANWVLQRFGLSLIEASIAIVDDQTIRSINRQHLDHDWPTDVISFAFETGPKTNGEVIASWDTAERLGRVAGWRTEDELVLYVLHGLLHLAGMDDLETDQRELMRSAEYAFLKDSGTPGAESYLSRFDDVTY
jgi:probable rRNA maturation factor